MKISDCSKQCLKFPSSNIDHIYVQELYRKMWGETNNAFQVDLLFVKVLFLNYFCFSWLQTFFTCDADAESADPSDECEC